MPRLYDFPRARESSAVTVGAGRASLLATTRTLVRCSRGKFDAHGHTGFAWAARRELLLDTGLYDACIAGGGDHLLAHAACGDWSTTCALRVTGGRTPLQRHASVWAERWHAAVQRRVGYVSGALLHLWHGDYQHRQYNARGHELAMLGFDPEIDLRIGANGCWEWASDNQALHRWALDYFEARFEDGTPPLKSIPDVLVG